MIRLLVLDIDGVLTDGRVLLGEDGREQKFLHYRDIDAVFAIRRAGVQIALLTGEDSPLVDVIAARLKVENVFRGRKDKGEALDELCRGMGIPLTETVYAGDSPRDVPALQAAGMAFAPSDADPLARAASIELTRAGGRGAVDEIVRKILEHNQAGS